MSGDEQVLREALRARAEDVDTVGDFLPPSVGLARRRARRVATAGLTTAVLVVGGISVATWVATSRPPTPQPVPATAKSTPPDSSPTTAPATPTASPSPSATDTPTPSSTSTASAGTVPWAMGATIHLASGTIDMGEGRRVTGFAPLASGGAVVATDAGSSGDDRWRIVDADGDVLDDLGRLMRVRVSRDGHLLSRQDAVDGPVTALDERGRRLASRDLEGAVVAVADGWVWATSQTGTTGWEVATGEVRRLDVRLSAVSADGRTGAGVHRDTDGTTRGCWLVVDLTRSSAPLLLERCGGDNPEGFVPTEFSDDGRLLLGHDDADGGFFSRLVVARVSDGRVVVGRTTHGEQVDGWSWALAPDGTTILFSRNVAEPRFPANRNDLARCTLELECTRAADRVRLDGGDVTKPWYVVGQPLLPTP